MDAPRSYSETEGLTPQQEVYLAVQQLSRLRDGLERRFTHHRSMTRARLAEEIWNGQGHDHALQ